MKKKNESIYNSAYEAGFRDAMQRAAADRPKRKPKTKRVVGDKPSIAASEAPTAETPKRNDFALVIGLLAGIFGLWGVAHVLNNKVVPGCVFLLVFGPVAAGFLATATIASASSLACAAFPIWLLLVYAQASAGASRG